MTVRCRPEETERWVCHFLRLGRLQKYQVWRGDHEFHLDVLDWGGFIEHSCGRQLDLEVWSSLKRLQINMLESPYTDVILSCKSECHLLVSIDREGGGFEVEHSGVGC